MQLQETFGQQDSIPAQVCLDTTLKTNPSLITTILSYQQIHQTRNS